jgi:oligoribonuclease NrnB/cAMP/cGMP phosphodiesterase (DHH superfamily)
MSESNSVSDVPIRAVVIYHDNCVDGFASAWAFKKLVESDYPNGVEYVPAQYGKPVNSDYWDARSDIYILDFSFSRERISELAIGYASVTVLDHHKTAAEVLDGWDHGFPNLEIVFDMERSGAGISWDYFSEGQPRPELIDYVEDRDIWKWELPDSKEINSLIGFTKKEFDAYDRLQELIGLKHDAAVGMGSLLLEQQQRHVQSIIDAGMRECFINGKRGLICDCPGQFASDVGNELAKLVGTYGATCYHDTEGRLKVSLRSIGDYDVNEIAKQFGGGGHKNAAGFVMSEGIPNTGGSGVTLWTIKDGNT